MIKDQGKKQIETIEDHVKQLAESNELIKKDFNIDTNNILPEQIEEQQKNLMNLL